MHMISLSLCFANVKNGIFDDQELRQGLLAEKSSYICIWCIWGVSGKSWNWCQKQFILILNNKLHQSNTSQCTFSSFTSSMHSWKDSSGMTLNSFVTAPMMASTPSKWVSFIILLEQDQVNREVIPLWQYSSQLGNVRCSGHCDGQAVMNYPEIIYVSSHALNESCTAGFPCRLAEWLSTLWQELAADDTSDIKERDSHDFDSLVFFNFSDIGDFRWLLWCLVFRLY